MFKELTTEAQRHREEQTEKKRREDILPAGWFDTSPKR
jgi:hypothetical protein